MRIVFALKPHAGWLKAWEINNISEWDICLFARLLFFTMSYLWEGIAGYTGGRPRAAKLQRSTAWCRKTYAIGVCCCNAPTSGHFNSIRLCLDEHSIHFLKASRALFCKQTSFRHLCLVYWLLNSHSAVNLPPWFSLRIFILYFTLHTTLRGYFRKEYNKSNITHF